MWLKVNWMYNGTCIINNIIWVRLNNGFYLLHLSVAIGDYLERVRDFVDVKGKGVVDFSLQDSHPVQHNYHASSFSFDFDDLITSKQGGTNACLYRKGRS